MAGTQFDPEVVHAFVAEIERRDGAAAEARQADPPVEPVVEHVRALLHSPLNGRGPAVRTAPGRPVIGVEPAA